MNHATWVLTVMLLQASSFTGAAGWSPEIAAYLKRKGTLKMCVAPDWLPMEGVDAEGRHIGIAADLLAAMAEAGGLELERYPAQTWDEAYQAAVDRRCDFLSLVSWTEDRQRHFDFTAPYVLIPNVIVTRLDVPFIDGIEYVVDQRLVGVRGFAGNQFMRDRFPGIEIVEVESYEAGLALVQAGEAFGVLANMGSISRLLQQQSIHDLKIAGRTGTSSVLSIATRNDEPELQRVFDQLIANLPPETRQAILNRWLPVRFEQGFDYRAFWRSLALIAVFVAILAVWLLHVQRLNRALAVANARLVEMSRSDPLTGLDNRRELEERLKRAIDLCARMNLRLAVALIDIDHFKKINDRHGHAVGDACLVALADVIRAVYTRASDLCVRYGGEEFLVAVVAEPGSDPLQRLEDLLAQLRNLGPGNGGIPSFTASGGVWVGIPDPEASPAALIQVADEALYQAKAAGRDRLVAVANER